MSKSLRLHQALAGGVAALALAGGWPALAQQQGVETVVVTAQKRSENIQNVPISMQALTAQTLQQLNIETFDDYLRYLPSVTSASNGPGQNEVFMP